MREGGPEVHCEATPTPGTGGTLAPDGAARCKVGTRLMAGKRLSQHAQVHSRSGRVPGGPWATQIFHGQPGADDMEKNPKPVMSAKAGRVAGLGGHLFTRGAEHQVRCVVGQSHVLSQNSAVSRRQSRSDGIEAGEAPATPRRELGSGLKPCLVCRK